MKRHAAAPFPEKAFQLLGSALTQIAAADITKDSAPRVREGIATLDRLIEFLPKFDSNSYPDGSLRRLEEARFTLNSGHVEDGLRALQRLQNSWEEFWRDSSSA